MTATLISPTAAADPAAGAPAWATRLASVAHSGTSSVFLLHGNTLDLVPSGASYGTLATFLAEQLFGRYDLVLHYDLGRGLRAFAGGSAPRLQQMIVTANKAGLDFESVKNDPAVVIGTLDALIRKTIMQGAGERLKIAVLIDQASFLFPSGEPGRFSYPAAGMLVTALNWASSPHLKALDVAIVMLDERKSDLNDRLTGNPHVTPIEVPLPDVVERERFLLALLGTTQASDVSDFGVPELAKLTAGLSLTNVRSLLTTAMRGNKRLDASAFVALKKGLLEQQCQGLLEFIEPKWGLDTVVGFAQAKQRLRDDASLLARGELECVPMGYLICGPVGTGKSFLAYCSAKEMGVPCVMLKNFRSKYVGETEGNLERVLAVLRAMGPILVIVDEADAALGDRDTEGDSGVGSRVFGMIATQMGDTRYRGRIVWMLLTARPDLLPIDIKRQGRAEVHIPLFYPSDEEDLQQMFVVLARKLGTTLAASNVPELKHLGQLSGSDIEGMVTRARRLAALKGEAGVPGWALREIAEQFLPSTQSLERELQELAALLECTDRAFLPPWAQKKLDAKDGRAGIQARLGEVRRLIAMQ